MVYTLIAYGFIWLLVFGYILFLHGRQSRLENQLNILEEMINEK